MMVMLKTVVKKGEKAREQEFHQELAEKVLAKNKVKNPAWELADDSWVFDKKDKTLSKKPPKKKKAD